MARVQGIQQRLDDSIFRDIDFWLEPIQQTSKLDYNIQVRGETTCQWILLNSTYARWMEATGGLFWYHGLSQYQSYLVGVRLADSHSGHWENSDEVCISSFSLTRRTS